MNNFDKTTLVLKMDTPNPAVANKPPVSTLHMPTVEKMITDIWMKLPLLETVSNNLDKLCKRTEKLEQKVCNITQQTSELETGLSHIEMEQEEVKAALESKASKTAIEKLEKEIIDMVNRNKRNNIILHNVPEAAEGNTTDCTALVHSFLKDSFDFQQSMEIDRAHRTPMTAPKRSTGASTGGPSTRPRPIHIRFLRYKDRERVLKAAINKRDNMIGGNRIYVSDDVHPSTREQHRRLLRKVKQLREEGHFAFIPWSVPRVIKYKEGGKNNPGPLKTLRDVQ